MRHNEKNNTSIKPLISIITVCFNSKVTIKDTFESVLNQTFQDFEYLIIDGGSTDGTIDIIKQYEEKFTGRLRWISEPDKGIYDAMNKGIDRSKGKIIGIINSDDWFEIGAFYEVYKIYKKVNNIDNFIIKGDMNFLTFDKIILNRIVSKRNLKKNLLKRMSMTHPSTFVSKNTYKKVGIFNTNYKLAADFDFIYRCFTNSINIYYIDKVLSNMRMGGASGFNNAYLLEKERLSIRLNYNKILKFPNIIFSYCYEISIISLRKFKRIFIKSKYSY